MCSELSSDEIVSGGSCFVGDGGHAASAIVVSVVVAGVVEVVVENDGDARRALVRI